METRTRKEIDTPAATVLALLDARARSVSWLAARIGRSPSHLTRVLAGERPMTDAVRAEIEDALGVADLRREVAR